MFRHNPYLPLTTTPEGDMAAKEQAGETPAWQLKLKRVPSSAEFSGTMRNTPQLTEEQQKLKNRNMHSKMMESAATLAMQPQPTSTFMEVSLLEQRAILSCREMMLRQQHAAAAPALTGAHQADTSSPTGGVVMLAPIFPSAVAPYAVAAASPQSWPAIFETNEHQQPQQPPALPVQLEHYFHTAFPVNAAPPPPSTSSAPAVSAALSEDEPMSALKQVANQTVAWFAHSIVQSVVSCNSPLALRTPKGIPLSQFVVYVPTLVSGYRMPPRTATFWLLRVFVGLLDVLHDANVERMGQKEASHVYNSSLSYGSPVKMAAEACGTMLLNTVYALCLRPPLSATTGKDVIDEALQAEWRHVHVFFAELLVRLFLCASISDSEPQPRASGGAAASLPQHPLLPPIPTSAVVVEALLSCAYRVRMARDVRTNSPLFRCGVAEGGDGQQEAALHMLEQQWVAFVKSIPPPATTISPKYMHLVPLLCRTLYNV